MNINEKQKAKTKKKSILDILKLYQDISSINIFTSLLYYNSSTPYNKYLMPWYNLDLPTIYFVNFLNYRYFFIKEINIWLCDITIFDINIMFRHLIFNVKHRLYQNNFEIYIMHISHLTFMYYVIQATYMPRLLVYYKNIYTRYIQFDYLSPICYKLFDLCHHHS